MLQDRLDLSQRRACQVVGQHRSTQRRAPLETHPDQDLRARLRTHEPILAGAIAELTTCSAEKTINSTARSSSVCGVKRASAYLA
jgi:hypothetical protein